MHQLPNRHPVQSLLPHDTPILSSSLPNDRNSIEPYAGGASEHGGKEEGIRAGATEGRVTALLVGGCPIADFLKLDRTGARIAKRGQGVGIGAKCGPRVGMSP